MVTRKSGKLAWGFVLLLPLVALSGYAMEADDEKEPQAVAGDQEADAELSQASMLTDKEIEQFLYALGLELMEELDTSCIEHRYFKNKKEEIVARVNGTHSIVFAKIR